MAKIVDPRMAGLERHVQIVARKIQRLLTGSFRFVLLVFDEKDPEGSGVAVTSAEKPRAARAAKNFIRGLGER